MLSLIGLVMLLGGLFFMIVGPFSITKQAPKEWTGLKKFGVILLLIFVLEVVSGFVAWLGLLLL